MPTSSDTLEAIAAIHHALNAVLDKIDSTGGRITTDLKQEFKAAIHASHLGLDSYVYERLARLNSADVSDALI